ncbi:hypothetical protein HMPREF0669_02011 (plasmid) [Prevotella sp. oral taxon 299 str. F0039]|nr:hypothetical protein HMPREF0669_02011 [Prevotella sp. oral taxon 299 str. F0039]
MSAAFLFPIIFVKTLLHLLILYTDMYVGRGNSN